MTTPRAKARAERKAAYFKSQLKDPNQLLRISGSACNFIIGQYLNSSTNNNLGTVYPDAQQFYYHENQNNLLA